MAISLARVVFWSVIASTPLALLVFAARRVGGDVWHNVQRMFIGYRWHIVLFVLIVVEKGWVDSLNDPIRGVFGDKTWLIHAIEGDATARFQDFFNNKTLTAVLNVHYLWMYVFLNYFSVVLFAYRDDRELANLTALVYSIIYILAIPFYIFFNVQVTSDFIPGMKALLYHSSPGFYDFFVRVDPLDNAFPSLHTAIPFGLVLVIYWTMRRRGYTLRNWEHRNYLIFLMVNTAIFLFSIIYLGIHWLMDIPGGLFVGLLGAIIADEFKWDTFRFFSALERRALAAAEPLVRRARAVLRR